jgi:uncharacterized protein (TIRG00374 family)
MVNRSWFRRVPWLRLAGVALFVVLLGWIDLGQIGQVLRAADGGLIAAAIAINLPMVFIKTVRWQAIMGAQGLRYPVREAYLAYWGSIFIGFFTPGRLGEFVKAAHVSRDCGVSGGQALSGVLADRLFDLLALLLVGGAALLALSGSGTYLLALLGLAGVLVVPVGLGVNERGWRWLRQQVQSLENWLPGKMSFFSRLLAEGSSLAELRQGLRRLTWPWLLAATSLTLLAYLVFFFQCYLLAQALHLRVGFMPVLYSVALGSLVTLLPVSISGLGTREAAMIAYLGTAGVPAEAALSFSLLVFFTFYVAGGALGAIAWWLKPVGLPTRIYET